MILDPPYDGHAEWHEHFFAPHGEPWPIDDDDEKSEYVGRHDAVEDRLGRIFVWDAEHGEVVVLCPDQPTACKIARALARNR